MSQRQCVIFNADDFGASTSINEAVIRAHREGVLTSASLMVNGDAFEKAVALAKQNPTLGVGLHLTLVRGRSTLASKKIPGLVNAQREFSNRPVWSGFRYYFKRSLRTQLGDEIAAQILRFRTIGLPMDHLNGHLHIHLHPTVFDVLMRRQQEWKLPAIRLTHEPSASGAEAYAFRLLSRRAEPVLRQAGIRHADHVFGLSQNGRVTEDYLLKLLPVLPSGITEIYSHPCTRNSPDELAGLVSPQVKRMLQELGLRVCRYQDEGVFPPPRA